MNHELKTTQDVERLFPSTVLQLKSFVKKAVNELTSQINTICSLKSEQITFDTTVWLFDTIRANFLYINSVLQTLEMLSQDNKIRKAARAHQLELASIKNKLVDSNQTLYKALMLAIEKLSKNSQLTSEQQRLVVKVKHYWGSPDHELSLVHQQELREIDKQLAQFTDNFENNITQDPHVLHVKKKDLPGISQDFLKEVRKAQDGDFILYPDAYILENCSNEHTRRAFWRVMVNKAYPENQKELENIISARDRMAQLLGYPSFSQMDIEGQTAVTPEAVENFINAIVQKCKNKLHRELTLLAKHLPDSVTLSNGKLKPWDLLYVKNYYKKNSIKIDELEISQYLPLEHTLNKILELLESIFDIQFKKTISNNLWDDQLTVLEVHKDSTLYGFIILDVYSRKNKYQYTLEQPILYTLKNQDGSIVPGLTVMVANFPYPSQRDPSLLRRAEVTSLLHEFGHMLHTLLAAQPIASQAGSQVKRDFVEVPSQMLEQFIMEPKILKFISCHYKTGKQLPERLIKKIEKIKDFDSADLVLEQCYYAALALYFFKEGAHKNIFELHKRLYKEIRMNLDFSDDDHSYAAFDHLVAYGAKYYSYLWSRVIALDIYYYIKQHSNSPEELKQITNKYVREVIMPGASKEPHELLKNFLGREPNLEAFLQSIFCC